MGAGASEKVLTNGTVDPMAACASHHAMQHIGRSQHRLEQTGARIVILMLVPCQYPPGCDQLMSLRSFEMFPPGSATTKHALIPRFETQSH